MIRWLFPRAESATVLAALENTMHFVTSDTLEQLLRELTWNHLGRPDEGPGRCPRDFSAASSGGVSGGH